MRTAIYIRVSTQEQAQEGFSIASQRQRLTQFAQSQDWDIFDYYMDEGISAKDTNRPELQRMLMDIRDGKIDVVLVYKLDRLTRSVLDLYKLLDEFQKHDTAFKSATEVYDTTTAIGRLFITLVAALAQWERENLGERVRVGMEQMVIEGKWTGGVAPFGYEWENGNLVVVPEETEIVKTIFQKYIEGYGDNKLTVWLNKQGYRTKKGVPWSHTSVGYVLTNPIYIQRLRWNYTSEGEYMEVKTNTVPRIIDDETFYMAQKIRKDRASMHPRSAGGQNVFSGRLKCGRCGSPLKITSVRDKGKKYTYYECTNKRKGLCRLPKIREDIIEKQLLSKVSLYRDRQSSMIAATENESAKEIEKEIRMIQNELKAIKNRKKKWHYAYANEGITLDELRELTQEDNRREMELRKRMESLKVEEHEARSPEEVIATLEDFETLWHAASKSEKKSMLQILVKSITVNSPHDNFRYLKFKDRTVEVEEIEFN